MFFHSKLNRIITILGIVGFLLFLLLSPRIFPSAAIDLSIPRSQIYQQAEMALQNHHSQALSQYQSVQSFSQDWGGSIYLQRTLGISETNRRIQAEQLPIYYWQHRWFQPSQQEEFYLYLSTTGDVVGYNHVIPEEQPGARLEEDAAQKIAENYLQTERDWNLNQWELVDVSTTQQPERTDHFFKWKRRDFSLGDSELRLTVGIEGDQVGYYNYWLKIPEAFGRQFRQKRNQASFFNRISYLILSYGALSAAFIFYIKAVSRKQIDWRVGLRPAFMVFGVSILAQWNLLPLAKNYYSTTENYTLFWIEQGYDTLMNAFLTAVPIYFLWLGGQQIAKQVWPERDKILPRSPYRLMAFTQSYWRGLMLGGIRIGYSIIFYWVAIQIFGSWSPLDVNYSNLFSTPLPFLSPLRSGILAAIPEELEARLIGIGMILLLTRNRWLALAIPGGLWAFAHLSYIRDPFYLRGIELWLPAIFLYGLFFLRFGLLTTIVGHCFYNAFLGASSLLKTQDAYLVGSGVLVIVLLLLPLLPGLVQYWQQPQKRRDFCNYRSLQIGSVSPEDLESLRSQTINDKNWKALWNGCQVGLDSEVVSLHSQQTIEGIAIARLETETSATVQSLYVNPKYRRCYYGTQLLNVLLQRLQQRGVKSVEVRVSQTHPSVERFWMNQGWQATEQTFSSVIPQPHRDHNQIQATTNPLLKCQSKLKKSKR